MRAGGAEIVFDGDARWIGPGGQDVAGEGLVYHAYDARDGGRPKLRVSALRWGDDGWPRL
jgi:arabinan endo-1,5-alpha-L-arabinosidase